jgi:uncharacterized membrane protein YbhN (UPF0104 family)
VIALIIFHQARKIAWHDVISALKAYRAQTLIQGGLLAAVAYALYASFDLIGVKYINARVSTLRTLGIAFVAYAVNQSLGSLLGTVGMRLRLYGKQGLNQVAISKLIGLAIVTNWLGYLLVAGTLFSARLIRLPDAWRLGNDVLQIIGAVMLLLVASYLALCRFSRTRAITIRSEQISLPSFRLAFAQLAVASLHWFAIAGILYLLMNGKVSYVLVLGTYMLTSVSAVIAHVPGGIGVIEAVFIALLSGRLPVPQLMAAVLAFRGIFYIGGLLLAGAVYLLLESQSARGQAETAIKAREI